MAETFTWMIGGPAGSGVLNAGLKMFSKSCLRSGLNVFAQSEYPSLIRGGHNYLTVSVSEGDVYSCRKEVNLLVALDRITVDTHMEDVRGGIIYDSSSFSVEFPEDILAFPIPLKKIAEKNGSILYRNTAAIGASFSLLGFGLEELENIIREEFSKKGEKIVEGNIRSARDGWNYVKEKKFPFKLEKRKTRDKILLSGNDAVVLGSIKAGCKFISAYPMTPATSILTGMASHSRDYGIIVKHTEDEIASINMAIGAGFAGVRSMTCTSGGGFALMSEGLGLAIQTETPVVIVVSQRPGPATGMATRTGQGDLNFVLHTSTDESPRVVIAPGDVEECYYLTCEAFNIAEKYQTPVIILIDKFLSTSYSSVPKFDRSVEINRGDIMATVPEGYKRYAISDSGVSPRVLPGIPKGEHVASSYEHNELGTEEESAQNRIKMHDKRFRKFESLAKELPLPKIEGNGEFVVVSWGSTKGIIREASKILKEENSDIAHLHLCFLSPFPKKVFSGLSKRIIVVENNKMSPLSDLLLKEAGVKVNHRVLKYDGRQFSPEELAEALREVMATGSESIVVR